MQEIDIGPILFFKKDYAHFEKWLGLDYQALTWQGRFQNDFNQFWEVFFVEGLSLDQLIKRFHYCQHFCKGGPLHSWLQWLQDHIVIFSFLHKDCSIKEISDQTGLSLSLVSLTLRNYFVEKFPFLEDALSQEFHLNHVISPKVHLTYTKLAKKISSDISASLIEAESNVLASLEVTLYQEFKDLTQNIVHKLFHPNLNLKKVRSETSWKEQMGFWRDVILFLLAALIVVYVVEFANEQWEKHLSQRISIYEPQLQWLDKNLVFRSLDESKPSEKVENLPSDGLEEIGKIEGQLLPNIPNQVNYDPESEVELTSLDSLPIDFETLDQETSRYQENQSSGFRDNRYGNLKVYRVLMKSEDTFATKEKLGLILKRYKASQADNVLPGTNVPGGIYYNLFVPRNTLKEFMAQVTELGEAVLYESRVQLRSLPEGTTKVFIWVKRI